MNFDTLLPVATPGAIRPIRLISDAKEKTPHRSIRNSMGRTLLYLYPQLAFGLKERRQQLQVALSLDFASGDGIYRRQVFYLVRGVTQNRAIQHPEKWRIFLVFDPGVQKYQI